MYWVYENYTHSRSLYHRFDCSKCREAANSRFQWHLCKTIKEAKEKSEYLARKDGRNWRSGPCGLCKPD